MIDQVPGYRILERAGEGGFSVVYRAKQERLDRIVALKVLSVESVDGATMRRFERECQITGRLTGHPNVVTVLDTGMTGSGKPFIAMDYFERGSLRDRLSREGPLPLQDVLRTGVKIAGALAATHEAGVLHRDVKPQNILVSRYGEPALADFGVARLVGSSEATHTNAFTPHHAAPEVVNGEQPGVTSDVYSLASSMYQLIAGEPAFKAGAGTAGGLNALMSRILNDPPPPFQRPDVPRRVYDVIATAMVKSPAQRYPTAVAFATALQRLQAELGLPMTELAGADFTAPPPVPFVPEPDHSGFTGPALERMLQQYAPPHLPAAHPDTAPPPAKDAPRLPGPVPGPADPSVPPPPPPAPSVTVSPPVAPARGFPSPGRQATSPPTAPRETTPHTFPKTTQPPPPTRGGYPPRDLGSPDDRKSRQGALVAGVLAAVVVGTGLGIGGYVVLSGNAGAAKGGTSPSPSPSSAVPRAASSAPVVPRTVLRAATPRDLRAVDKGSIVALRWKLAKNNNYPIWVQQADASGTPSPPQAIGPHAESISLPVDPDPAKGYCFTVGSLVALGRSNGQAATIAWSKPVCIRHATAR